MSTFGHYFRVTTYGESHCPSVGCIVDGVPPGMELTAADIQPQMTRRRPGQSALTTPRDEKDRVEIQSGTEFGLTLGTPIAMIVKNEDQRPKDYGGKGNIQEFPRPSHADWTYLEKYGVKASSGGGRSSARETIGRVAASGIAEKYLKLAYGTSVTAFVSSVGDISLFDPAVPLSDNQEFLALSQTLTREEVDSFLPVRCPSKTVTKQMEDKIAEFRDKHDSIGGTVTCVIRNAPAGLGEPCFDKLEAALAHAMLSIPATKGFEIGSGFAGTAMAGSTHNDAFIAHPTIKGKLITKTNHSGGIQGGISLSPAVPIFFRVAFKSAATISVAQTTTSYSGEEGILEAKGRHDPCVVPRAVPIVEAMASLVIMDAVAAQESRMALRSRLPDTKGVLRPEGWVDGLGARKENLEETSTVAEVGLDQGAVKAASS